MKKLLYIIAAVAMTLTACNKEAADPTEQGKKGTPLVIDVAVVSPTSPISRSNSANSANSASPSTRATDTGYDTAFDEGDAIGIWVYEEATEVYINKQWVRQADGTWSPATPDDEIYYNGTAMTINAYFPYVTGLSALPEAATFTVQDDQSALENYRASDLLLSTSQTWGGTAVTLPLTFAHAMAMVEAVPSSTADLQSVTLAAKTSEVADAATAVTFCPMDDGTYRALLPAQDLATSLFFNYTTESYAFPTNTALAAGSYYKYDVMTVPVPTAAVGDYYYSDGSYSATLNTAKTCVGIVFRAQTDDQNGLVVSLTETTSIKWATSSVTTYATSDDNGAENMKTIMNIDGWETKYPAFKWCADIGAGWYLPSKYEIKNLCASYNGLDYSTITGWDEDADNMPGFFDDACKAARPAFDTKLTDAGGMPINAIYYWSSSEISKSLACSFSFESGYTDQGAKSNIHSVRAILAF